MIKLAPVDVALIMLTGSKLKLKTNLSTYLRIMKFQSTTLRVSLSKLDPKWEEALSFLVVHFNIKESKFQNLEFRTGDSMMWTAQYPNMHGLNFTIDSVCTCQHGKFPNNIYWLEIILTKGLNYGLLGFVFRFQPHIRLIFCCPVFLGFRLEFRFCFHFHFFWNKGLPKPRLLPARWHKEGLKHEDRILCD